MACCSNTTTNTCNSCGTSYGCKSNNGFLLVIVLYILLAIILGSYIC